MSQFNQTITLTFCESGENHIGMEMLGTKAEPGQGFNLENLLKVKSLFQSKQFPTELYRLSNFIDKPVEEAYILVIRKGINYFLKVIFKKGF